MAPPARATRSFGPSSGRPQRPRNERRLEDKGNPNGPERRKTKFAATSARDARPADTRGGRAMRGFGGGRWFTVNVGRSKHADPKWLIPLLCRRGNVTKKSIGKIEVLMRETRVEIAADAADSFARAILRPDDKDRNIHIEPIDET